MSVELQGAIIFLLAFQQRLGILTDSITGNVRQLEAIDRIIAEYDHQHGLIGGLRRVPTKPQVAQCATPAVPKPAAAPAPTAVTAKAPARTFTHGGRRTSAAIAEAHAAIDASVLTFLKTSGASGVTKIRSALKLSESQLKGSLIRLRARHLVRLAGTRAAARWSIDPAAKLPKTPPAPTTFGIRATAGAAAGPGRTLNGAEFETVWDGSKERAGQAPSLIGARTQRPA